MSFSERFIYLAVAMVALCIISYLFIPPMWLPIQRILMGLVAIALALLNLAFVVVAFCILVCLEFYSLYRIVKEVIKHQRDFHTRIKSNNILMLEHQEMIRDLKIDQSALSDSLFAAQRQIKDQHTIIEEFKKILLPQQVHDKQLDTISREFVGDTLPWKKLQDSTRGHWNEPLEDETIVDDEFEETGEDSEESLEPAHDEHHEDGGW